MSPIVNQENEQQAVKPENESKSSDSQKEWQEFTEVLKTALEAAKSPDESQMAHHESPSGPCTPPLSECREGSVTPTAYSPKTPCAAPPIPGHMVAAWGEWGDKTLPFDLQEMCYRKHQFIPYPVHRKFNENFFPSYPEFSFPEEVIYGLKVWELDGDIWYKKTLRSFECRYWFWKEEWLAQLEVYKPTADGYFYSTKEVKVEESFRQKPDWTLFWFLLDRGREDLWHSMIGTTPRELGHRLSEFPMRP